MRKVSIITLSLLLFIGLLPNDALATEKKSDLNKEEELAGKMEVFFEEVVIKNDTGDPVGIDKNKLEKEFGDDPEFDSLQKMIAEEDNDIQPMINPSGPTGKGAEMRRCQDKKIVQEWKGYLTGSVISNIIDAMMSGNYKKGAKLLIKNGVKGSVPGIASTLAIHWYECYQEVS